ncbi:MAG: hypothetical protein QOI46_1166 [Alphaproteobacteria bacterium]|nr:hypothetical protein [Alphaproteobacteria bacterium]
MTTLNDCVLVVEDEFFIADQYGQNARNARV